MSHYESMCINCKDWYVSTHSCAPTFLEWTVGKYMDHRVNRACEYSNLIWHSRWYPIGGHLDGQCWNLYKRHDGSRAYREVLRPEGLGPLIELRWD